MADYILFATLLIELVLVCFLPMPKSHTPWEMLG